jgi:methionyl-tRNA synthetase
LSTAIYHQLGFVAGLNQTPPTAEDIFRYHARWGVLPCGQPLTDPYPVFQKLERLETLIL